MHVNKHIIVSGITSGIFAFFSRSANAAIVCFLSGIFIDIDHVFDFWITKKKLFFSYKDLDTFCSQEKTGKLYLSFHSIEPILILWLIILYLNLNIVWVGLAVGLSLHLLLDITTNPLRPIAYFLYYRLKQRFKKEFLFTEEYYREIQ